MGDKAESIVAGLSTEQLENYIHGLIKVAHLHEELMEVGPCENREVARTNRERARELLVELRRRRSQ